MAAVANFEDYLNIDLLSSSGGSSSRDSSASPESAHTGFPQTPPQPTETLGTVTNMDDAYTLFSSLLEQDYEKISTEPMSTLPPFDLFSSYSALDAASSNGSPILFDNSQFAIDPQLMALAPTASSSTESPASVDPEEDEEDEDMYDIIAPVKVGGKGKSARKGTVSSGGVKKFGGQAVRDEDDPDDWRPTVDEYKKMTSKEKRQLRNKISARNFRVRRKEYITTLEGEVADRDQLIHAIRKELGDAKLENAALRKEVDALKRAMLEGRVAPTLPPPGSLDAVTAATDAATAKKPATRRQALLAKPNTQKDVSPRNARFWGGTTALGGITPVHTTLVPDFVSLIGNLSEKHAAVAASPDLTELQENINPALNGARANTQTVNNVVQQHPGANTHGFDSFMETNPFTLKNLEAYRMQLWGKMAREMSHNNSQTPPPRTPLANGVMPLFLDSSNIGRPSLSAILSGKTQARSSISPATLPKQEEVQPAAVLAAAVASHTLMSRMTNAFWDAFSGSPASGSSSIKRDLDANKVRRVLEGKAVVQVVDVEQPPKAKVESSPKPAAVRPDPAAALEESMRTLSIGGSCKTSSETATEKWRKDRARALHVPPW